MFCSAGMRRSSAFLKAALAMGTCLLIIGAISWQSRDKAMTGLQHTMNKLLLKVEQLKQPRTPNITNRNIIQSTERVANSPQEKSMQYDPLSDYVAFPCVDGLPPFPTIHQAKRGKCVRTVNTLHHADTVNPKECVPLNTPNGSTPICIHDVKADHYISQSLKSSGRWESDLVTPLCNTLTQYPGMEFLDLGCNIGVYSLSAAHVGKTVVCVDPLVRNLQLLAKSIHLGKLSDKVTLIWNAISNDYSEVALLVYNGNVGGTAIQNINKTNGVDYFVRTIRLDDLLPLFKGKQLGIKMDVETQELNVLNGGRTFFDQVDIRFIQMEINWHRSRPSGPPIIEFLADRGFLAYKDIKGSLKLDPANIKNWPGDVYFIKSQ